jgi:hypothetical protein
VENKKKTVSSEDAVFAWRIKEGERLKEIEKYGLL